MMKALEWLVANWSIVVGIIALIAMVVVAVIQFMKLPTTEQRKKIQKCLLSWVIEAERDLGGGTGKVKLSTVYGTFVTAFPILKNFISFETFSVWVDEALDEMRKMLEENENLKQVVENNIIMIEEAVELIAEEEEPEEVAETEQ